MKKIILFILCFASSSLVNAEYYIGGTLGYSFGQKFTNLTNTENLNYPNTPGANQLIGGGKISDATAGNTFGFSLKGGKYFDEIPNLGIELAFNYNKVKVNRQNITLTNPGFIPATGFSSFTEDQLESYANMYQIAVNLMYRFTDKNSKWTPYVGVGPTFTSMRFYGTGYSGITISPPSMTSPGVNGPNISSVSNTFGVNGQLGLLYDIGNQYKLGLEYRYNWIPLNIQNYRSSTQMNGTYTTNTVGITMIKSF